MAAWQIRRISEADVDAALDVWRRSRWEAQPWLEERMAHTREDDRAFFQGTLLRDTQIWVALDGARLLALMALAGEQAASGAGPEAGKIEQLYVDPDGQGQGVGSALIDHAKALFPKGLSLFTHQRNERARAFYEHRGFEAIAFGVSSPPESEPDVAYRWAP